MDNFSTLQPALCLQCEKSIHGRADKRFCDAYCRNVYNNRVKRNHELRILQVNKAMRKNRRILKSLSPIGKTTVRKEVLDAMGYDYSIFSSLYQSTKGSTYYLCYDYGYLPLVQTGIQKALIITRQDYMNKWNPWKNIKKE